MQYIANKTVTRYNGDKPPVVVLKKGKKYTQEQVNQHPDWYLTDGLYTIKE